VLLRNPGIGLCKGALPELQVDSAGFGFQKGDLRDPLPVDWKFRARLPTRAHIQQNLPVRLWHKADIKPALSHVRFRGYSKHPIEVHQCLLMTQSGHEPAIAALPLMALA
jgi:hypothetical protein